MTKEYELRAKHDSRNSFYGKTVVKENEDSKELYSYNTLVSRIDLKKGVAKIFGCYSTTTGRHINEFLRQEGFRTATKEEMEQGVEISKC